MEALGAVVATINFNELQMALKQGVVDGQENPIAVIYSNKIYETQKYLAMTGHNYNSMVHVISKKVWDKLTAAQKKIVQEESKKAGDWMRKSIRDAEADQINKLKGFGMEVTYPDKKEFKKLMKPAYDRMEGHRGRGEHRGVHQDGGRGEVSVPEAGGGKLRSAGFPSLSTPFTGDVSAFGRRKPRRPGCLQGA